MVNCFEVVPTDSKAQAEPRVETTSVADDLWRETVASVL